MRITTDRLELIAGTLELAHADIEDRTNFASMLDALVPDKWPPPLNDLESQTWFMHYLDEHPDGVGWVTWYFILLKGKGGQRVAIGNGGFKGKPTADGTVEVGYSILEEFQQKGYATEAARGLIAWAFEHENIQRVIAETYPVLNKSIRVLEKNGFVLTGDGSEEGVIRYELSRRKFDGIAATLSKNV
jgi:[ribosomal protein S5]-alanine N-acetyltransferase